MSESPQVLIVGCGGIGLRHARCFQKAGGVTVRVFDRDEAKAAAVAAELGVERMPDWETVLGTQWEAAVVATPAHTHLQVAGDLLPRTRSLLIEKPLALEVDSARTFLERHAERAADIGVGYNWRFWEGLQQARDWLRAGRIGRPLQVAVRGGQHYPTFRPDYRSIYFARHESGGGTIQDALTHWINSTEWLVGSVTRVYAETARLSLPDVEVEDTVSLTARHGEIIAGYSMNQFQAPNEAGIEIAGEEGNLRIEAHRQVLSHFARGSSTWEEHPFPVADRDDYYVAQARGVLSLPTRTAGPLCSLAEALQTLRVNTAALESARTGRAVDLLP